MNKRCLSLLLMAAGFFAAGNAAADAPATQPATVPASADDSGLVIAYTGDPPDSGKVTTRLEGEGGRCLTDPSVTEYALGSDVTGLTTAAHPKLVWYLNKAAILKVRILITDPSRHTTVHLWQANGLVPAGIHVLDTSGSDFSLEPGVEYKWTVRIVNDETDPSKDMYSSGMIKRVEASDPIAVGHSFYDAMGAAATALGDASKDGNDNRRTAAEKSLNDLLDLEKLPRLEQLAVTVDAAGK
jgi:Domain of Unknown Function (DUF928)